MTNFKDVRNFHEKFGLTYDGVPRQLPLDVQEFRDKFLDEELQEYKEAVYRGDLAQQFDALIDLVYVAMGTAQLHGFPWQKGWELVQAANMAKVKARSALESTRGYALDVVKPHGWTPPDIQTVLDEQTSSIVRASK